MWLDSPVEERQPRDREVAGSSLAHCAVDYGSGQATNEHLSLSPSSIICGGAAMLGM